MARRMIDDSMWANECFAEMPMGARLLQIGIVNHADDQGRMKANPAYLRAQIFPYDDIDTSSIQGWLELMASNQTILLYQVNGRQYIQLINWWKYQSLQYAQPSQYPRSQGWVDRIRKTITKGVIATCNWQKVNGEPIEDTCDQDGNLIPNGHNPSSDNDGGVPIVPDENPPGKDPENTDGSPEPSPEPSPEDTIELNLTKLNITKNNSIAPDGEPPSAVVVDSGFVFELWENNMPGSLTPIIVDEINDFVDTYGALETETAIRLAVKANKRNTRYVRGILVKRAAGEDNQRASPMVAMAGVSGELGFDLNAMRGGVL